MSMQLSHSQLMSSTPLLGTQYDFPSNKRLRRANEKQQDMLNDLGISLAESEPLGGIL